MSEPDPSHDPHQLPDGLPQPVDDGACDRLPGAEVPHRALVSTGGGTVDLDRSAATWTVVFVYPRTGVPGRAMPDGWDSIPGARGCTPQACAYRDRYQSLLDLGAEVYGLSTQTNEAQQEFAEREHLPFALLSDPDRRWGQALGLPTFTVDGAVLYRRVTLVLQEGRVAHVRYPVFPTDEDAGCVDAWIGAQDHTARAASPRGHVSIEAAAAAVRADRDTR